MAPNGPNAVNLTTVPVQCTNRTFSLLLSIWELCADHDARKICHDEWNGAQVFRSPSRNARLSHHRLSNCQNVLRNDAIEEIYMTCDRRWWLMHCIALLTYQLIIINAGVWFAFDIPWIDKIIILVRRIQCKRIDSSVGDRVFCCIRHFSSQIN